MLIIAVIGFGIMYQSILLTAVFLETLGKLLFGWVYYLYKGE